MYYGVLTSASVCSLSCTSVSDLFQCISSKMYCHENSNGATKQMSKLPFFYIESTREPIRMPPSAFGSEHLEVVQVLVKGNIYLVIDKMWGSYYKYY